MRRSFYIGNSNNCKLYDLIYLTLIVSKNSQKFFLISNLGNIRIKYRDL